MSRARDGRDGRAARHAYQTPQTDRSNQVSAAGMIALEKLKPLSKKSHEAGNHLPIIFNAALAGLSISQLLLPENYTLANPVAAGFGLMGSLIGLGTSASNSSKSNELAQLIDIVERAICSGNKLPEIINELKKFRKDGGKIKELSLEIIDILKEADAEQQRSSASIARKLKKEAAQAATPVEPKQPTVAEFTNPFAQNVSVGTKQTAAVQGYSPSTNNIENFKKSLTRFDIQHSYKNVFEPIINQMKNGEISQQDAFNQLKSVLKKTFGITLFIQPVSEIPSEQISKQVLQSLCGLK